MKPILKILMLKGLDWANYFVAIELMKNGSYKGLSVVQWQDKRKPEKAKQMFVPASHVSESGWRQISASDIPPKVQARFAEVA